jgi:hypothetical protein
VLERDALAVVEQSALSQATGPLAKAMLFMGQETKKKRKERSAGCGALKSNQRFLPVTYCVSISEAAMVPTNAPLLKTDSPPDDDVSCR